MYYWIISDPCNKDKELLLANDRMYRSKCCRQCTSLSEVISKLSLKLGLTSSYILCCKLMYNMYSLAHTNLKLENHIWTYHGHWLRLNRRPQVLTNPVRLARISKWTWENPTRTLTCHQPWHNKYTQDNSKLNLGKSERATFVSTVKWKIQSV